jgi:hypothetical protein
MKGRKAYLDGLSLHDNPYSDKKTDAGKITWSRAYIWCWHDGWTDMQEIIEENNGLGFVVTEEAIEDD